MRSIYLEPWNPVWWICVIVYQSQTDCHSPSKQPHHKSVEQSLSYKRGMQLLTGKADHLNPWCTKTSPKASLQEE